MLLNEVSILAGAYKTDEFLKNSFHLAITPQKAIAILVTV